MRGFGVFVTRWMFASCQARHLGDCRKNVGAPEFQTGQEILDGVSEHIFAKKFEIPYSNNHAKFKA